MPRERKEFVRRSGFRDASLVVIACEGSDTEPDYFNGLKFHLHSSRLHVEVLERSDASHSSPQHVCNMLDRFHAAYHLRPGDALWLVADRDPQSWSNQMLSEVATRCRQKEFHLAVSNPCFELWLLLHFEDIPNQPATHAELLQNRKQLLKTRFAVYRIAGVSLFDTCGPHLTLAVQRAKTLDTNPQDRWPQGLGTHVYRLVEALQQRVPSGGGSPA